MYKLLLQKNIYSEQSISDAREAFSGIASISLDENDDYYVCSFSSCAADETLTMKEFENYLIDLANTHNEHN